MSERQSNRQRFPHCSSVVDSFRESFGDVMVEKVSEGGRVAEARTRVDESAMVVLTAREFLEIGRVEREAAKALASKQKRGRR